VQDAVPVAVQALGVEETMVQPVAFLATAVHADLVEPLDGSASAV
jgi:hypothetical protein